jgi:hypothetical protein
LREQLLRVLNDEPGARESCALLLAEYQLTIEGIATKVFQTQMPLELDADAARWACEAGFHAASH